MGSNVPAGWYPDPERAGQQRYWDGSAWTDHRAPLAPDAAPNSPETGHAGAGGVPDSSDAQPPTQEPDRRSWFARHKVLTTVAAVFALLIAIGALSGGEEGPPETEAEPTPTVSVTATQTATQTATATATATVTKTKRVVRTVTVQPEQPPPPDEPSGNCAPNYDPCIPPFPPDLDCEDVDGPITVTGLDPHDLDRDGDGVACET
jgi:Protein of unknown function (DUF2510)/Excalibur calcium-binding domain